jgi:hypothetical protein
MRDLVHSLLWVADLCSCFCTRVAVVVVVVTACSARVQRPEPQTLLLCEEVANLVSRFHSLK